MEKLRELILQTIAQVIAERVGEKLAALQKRALVVFTGSLIGFDTSLAELAKLRESGFTFDVYMSDGALALLDRDKIKSALAPGKFIEGSLDTAPEIFAAPYMTLIVPALTVNTAAKLANCMADSVAARIISNSLMRGKNVIIVRDGSCPDNPARAEKGYRMSEPLKTQLRENLNKIQSYGAVFADSNTLCRKTLKAIDVLRNSSYTPSPKAGVSREMPAAAAAANARRLVSRADVMCIEPGSALKVDADAMVTQLAVDAARARGVKIIRA